MDERLESRKVSGEKIPHFSQTLEHSSWNMDTAAASKKKECKTNSKIPLGLGNSEELD